MAATAVCLRSRGRSHQKPTRLETSRLGVICACWLLACGTTPIDAVVEADTGASGASGSGNVMSVKCDEPSAGRFILQAATGCLALGAPTMVFTQPAFSAELSMACATSRAQWDLTPSVAGTFTLRNVESELSLDVRAFSDQPGTPVILYDPNTLDNQRFFVRPRATGAYELAPRHAPGLCAEARAGAVEIWPCDGGLEEQSFRFLRSTCP